MENLDTSVVNVEKVGALYTSTISDSDMRETLNSLGNLVDNPTLLKSTVVITNLHSDGTLHRSELSIDNEADTLHDTVIQVKGELGDMSTLYGTMVDAACISHCTDEDLINLWVGATDKEIEVTLKQVGE